MNFNEYDDIVREWTTQVLAVHITDPDKAKECCVNIIARGRKDKDSKLLGFAHYYLAEAFFYENDYKKFIRNLIKGLKYQQEADMGKLLARSYNMLGINSDNQGNISAAIDYYLTSMKYSQEYGLEYEAGLANGNIGQIYVALKDYRTAISYLEKALLCWQKSEENSQSEMHSLMTRATIGTCYYRLDDMEAAHSYFSMIEQVRDKYENNHHIQMVLLIYEILFYDKKNEQEMRDDRISRLIRLIDEIPSLMDLYDEAFALCEILADLKRYEDLWRVLDRMQKLTRQAGFTNMLLRLLKIKIKCYQQLKMGKEYLQACAEYLKLSEKLENENRTIAKRAIELRLDLEQVREKQSLIQEENKLLQEKSERDPLTQLPNREKLNHYAEAAFERAFRNQTRLGVEIFDIDCFKEYNDTYGHQAGDKILKKMAQLLHSLMERGIFCARYGGDEFIIIYEDMTDDEIFEIASKLKEDVINMNIKNKNSSAMPVITISQGIRNTIPHEMNKIWDFFYVADMTMYEVKRNNKNDISLVHKLKLRQGAV